MHRRFPVFRLGILVLGAIAALSLTAASGKVRFAVIFLMGVVMFLNPSTTHGQAREGFWFAGAGGGALASPPTQERDDGWQEAFVGYLSAGWTLTDVLLVGAEARVLTKTQFGEETVDPTGADITAIMGTVAWYPRQRWNCFLKGGAGASVFFTNVMGNDSTETELESGTGPALLAGVGCDFSVGRRVSWTVGTDYWYARPGTIQDPSAALSNWRPQVFDIVLGLTFH